MWSSANEGTSERQADARSFCVLSWERSASDIACVVRSRERKSQFLVARGINSGQTSFEATISIRYICTEDDMVEEGEMVFFASVQAQLSRGL